jgi:putative oxidoreductase
MFAKLVNTSNDFTLTILRVVLGSVFFAHGAQKVLGWFGGKGIDDSVAAFTQFLGIPAPLAYLAIAAEFVGGAGLVVGLLGRIAALGILTNMVVAIVLVHARNGLFMNWTGKQAGEGFEYHLLAIAIALAILIRGSGALSIDRLLTRSSSPPA